MTVDNLNGGVGRRVWNYATRVLPAASVLLVATILIFSFVLSPYGKVREGAFDGSATPWQLALSFYTVLLHGMSILFPARVCWAMGNVTANMRAIAARENKFVPQKVVRGENEKNATEYPAPLFVIILPAYKEDLATLEETIRVLASHPQAHQCYHLYLAMEEKEDRSAWKAAALVNTFKTAFFRMSYTVHPQGIPGEAQGKSSNESWAAKQACKDYDDAMVKRNTIITVMDADTHFSHRYFSEVARLHAEHVDQNDSTMYVPPIVFDRNLHHVPLPVRTADLMWAGAGLSSLYNGSTVCIPTSVYSLPMALVEQVGGWDTGPDAIGEDLHMYLKCFFATSGNLHVQIVYAAASQCNVSSDVRGITGYIDGLGARYKQALRHMWGSLDTGYAFRQAVSMVSRRWASQNRCTDLPLSAPNANWTAFYTSNDLHLSLAPKSQIFTPAPTQPINFWNTLTVFVRLFEAHFLPIHLVVILTTSGIFTMFQPAFLIPDVLRLALDICGWCRLAGWLLMLCFFWRYNVYHRLCASLRQEEMQRAGLLEDMIERDGFTMQAFRPLGILQMGLFPIGGVIFGAIPAVQAVLSHVLTNKLTYVVSLKPQAPNAKIRRSMTP